MAWQGRVVARRPPVAHPCPKWFKKRERNNKFVENFVGQVKKVEKFAVLEKEDPILIFDYFKISNNLFAQNEVFLVGIRTANHFTKTKH